MRWTGRSGAFSASVESSSERGRTAFGIHMCGIAGVYGVIDDAASNYTTRMCDAMVHRGPDQDGIWRSSGRAGCRARSSAAVHLGSERSRSAADDRSDRRGRDGVQRRVSTTSPSSEPSSQSFGRRFISSTDSEVILAAYLAVGRARHRATSRHVRARALGLAQ